MEPQPIQVADDPALLERMLSDMRQSPAWFQPTHFWHFYEQRFLPELRAQGLTDFRRRHDSVLASFGGTDPYIQPFSPSTRDLLRKWPWVYGLANRLRPATPMPHPRFKNIVAEHHYWRVKDKFRQLGMDLGNCPTSYVGNPEGVVEIEGKPWTATHLEYCSLVADAARYVPFQPDGVFCELGAGMGRNVEILASLCAEATILLFDIPPQLYVANQYLQKVFEVRVVPYREANALDPMTDLGTARIRGKIILQPTWRIPDWMASLKLDVFWNSASFQEMAPDVVVNYLTLVKRLRPEFVYINAMPEGNHHPGAASKGGLGTRAPVLESCYTETLSDSYQLAMTYDTDHLDGGAYGYHRSYVFKRKATT